MPQPHQFDGAGNFYRFLRVKRRGMGRRTGCTEAAGARADITSNHKGGRPTAPAGGDIGTAATGTNGMQIVLPHDSGNLGITGIVMQFYFQPFGFVSA